MKPFLYLRARLRAPPSAFNGDCKSARGMYQTYAGYQPEHIRGMPLEHKISVGNQRQKVVLNPQTQLYEVTGGKRDMWTYYDAKNKINRIENFNPKHYNQRDRSKPDRVVRGYVVMPNGEVAFVDPNDRLYYPNNMPADKKLGQTQYKTAYMKKKGITVRPPRQATPAPRAKGAIPQGNRFAALSKDKIRFNGDWFKSADSKVKSYFIARNKTDNPFSGENIPLDIQEQMPKEAVKWFYTEKAKRSGQVAPTASKPQPKNSLFHLELSPAEKEKVIKTAAKNKLHATLQAYIKAVETGINKAEIFDSGGKLDVNRLKEEMEEFVSDFQGSKGIFENRPADMRMNNNLSKFYQIITTPFTGSATENNENAKKAFSTYIHGGAEAYADAKNQEVSKTKFVDGLRRAFELLEKSVVSMSNYYEKEKLMTVKEENFKKKVAQGLHVTSDQVNAKVTELVTSSEPLPNLQSQYAQYAIINTFYHNLPETLNGQPKKSLDATGILVEILKTFRLDKLQSVLPRWMEPSPLFYEAIKEIKVSQGKVYYSNNGNGVVRRHLMGDPNDIEAM